MDENDKQLSQARLKIYLDTASSNGRMDGVCVDYGYRRERVEVLLNRWTTTLFVVQFEDECSAESCKPKNHRYQTRSDHDDNSVTVKIREITLGTSQEFWSVSACPYERRHSEAGQVSGLIRIFTRTPDSPGVSGFLGSLLQFGGLNALGPAGGGLMNEIYGHKPIVPVKISPHGHGALV
jgi:hypothetical protein